MEHLVETWARLQELIARSEVLVAQSRRVTVEMHEQSEHINRLLRQADQLAKYTGRILYTSASYTKRG